MTDEELDEARAKEAWRLLGGKEGCVPYPEIRRVVTVAARLSREGWMPVDPLGAEADELIGHGMHMGLRQFVIAALRRGMELAKEK